MKYFIIVNLLVLMIFSFQNCKHLGENTSSFRPSGINYYAGNGEEYDGKLRAGHYLRTIPGHTCGGELREHSLLNISTQKIILSKNISDECDNQNELSSPEFTFSNHNSDYVGYKSGIYKYSKDKTLNNNIYTELWCRSPDLKTDYIVEWFKKEKNNSLKILSNDTLTPIIINTQKKVEIKNVSYVSDSMSLMVDLTRPLPHSKGEFRGYLKSSKNNLTTTKIVSCRTGGLIDIHAAKLQYSSYKPILIKDQVIQTMIPKTEKNIQQYTVSPQLPDGVILNESNGSISGSPNKYSPRTLYTISAHHATGVTYNLISLGVGKEIIVDSFVDSEDKFPGDDICASNKGNCSLRAAVNEANALIQTPTVIRIPQGNHTLSLGEIIVTGDISLIGSGPLETVIDGQSLSRVIKIEPGSKLDLIQLKITNGAALKGGAIYSESARLSLDNVNISKNKTIPTTDLSNSDSTREQGAGIYSTKGKLIIKNSEIVENLSSKSGNSQGGALYASETEVEIYNSQFNGNASHEGGALFLNPAANHESYINQTNFKNNESMNGGAITQFTGNTMINQSSFFYNLGSSNGGAILGKMIYQLSVINSTLYGNIAMSGAAIYGNVLDPMSELDSLNIIHSTITKNTSSGSISRGSTIAFFEGTLKIANSIISNNETATNCYLPYIDLQNFNHVISMGGNIVDDSTCKLSPNNDQINTDAKLNFSQGPMTAENSTEYIQLESNSPAINFGNSQLCPLEDQIQNKRNQVNYDSDFNHCDSGAIEAK